MFFGGANGFNRFFPGDIKDNTYIPPVVITSCKKLNRPLKPGKHISEVDELEFSYRDPLISFEFAALSYSIPEKNRYAYMLEGLHDDWIHLGTRRNITFGGLKPGNYVLRIKGSNSDGVWNEQGHLSGSKSIPPSGQT